MENETSYCIALENSSEARELFGYHDAHLKLIEQSFKVKIVARGCNIEVLSSEQDSELVVRLLNELLRLLRNGYVIGSEDVKYAIRMIKGGKEIDLGDIASEGIQVFSNKVIRPKTRGQKLYVAAMRRSDLVFSIGPAGTGKTYLAMAMAVSALKKGEVGRIVLTRPAVEAGERLGFLPGDIIAKTDPYLRPLYDALYEMMPIDKIETYTERSMIEVAPLAFMRGRTLNNSFVILDEAQNTTCEQMKMFLTRLGFDSRAVITGDITQIDLPNKRSGLIDALSLLSGIEGIEFVYLTSEDVIRHPLVQKIIEAYEKRDSERQCNP